MAAGLPLIFEHFSGPRYADCDIYSMSDTVQGVRSMERLGFERGVIHHGNTLPDLFICRRNPASISAQRPRYDSFVPALGTGIHVAHGIDDYFKVAAIRSAVYLGEQACPYAEEFDGNDHAATHLLGWHDHEPAACMRVRFFGRFAKLERLAVRREFRKSQLAFDMVRAAVELCRAKGFRQLYGHARQDLLPFWQRFGFQLKENGAPFGFSGHMFVEMVEECADDNHAIDIGDGPYVTIRPEGRWHQPGVLETSAVAAAAE
ncbi:MAG: GNAT family N-acetyltransferase [Hyphomicrobiales bacterium]